MTDLVTQALALHKQGLHVFPADHPDQPKCIGEHDPVKIAVRREPRQASRRHVGDLAIAATPQMIDLAWTKRGGLANIGVACGPSDLVVLDEDELGELDRWCTDNGITLPETYDGHHRPRAARVLPLGPQRPAHRQRREGVQGLQDQRAR